MMRVSAMRGDFRFERIGDGWGVFRRVDGEFVPIGIAQRRGARENTNLWDGVRSGHVVCVRYRSREQVAYCLDRLRREEDAG